MLVSTDMLSLSGLNIMIEQSLYIYHIPNGINITLGHYTESHFILII